MNLWLSPHDARVRALRSRGELDYGFAVSPLGGCAVLVADKHLLALHFKDSREEAVASLRTKWPASALRPSEEADAMVGRAFDQPTSIPLIAIGTPFQLLVWEFLRRIREAETLTYGEVAAAIGRPGAARAVGGAVGANEISVLIPCHRVVSRGKLAGYRWGAPRKKALLAWELARRDPLTMPF